MVSSFKSLDSAASGHTKNIFSSSVKSSLVKLETRCTVILPPTVSVLCRIWSHFVQPKILTLVSCVHKLISVEGFCIILRKQIESKFLIWYILFQLMADLYLLNQSFEIKRVGVKSIANVSVKTFPRINQIWSVKEIELNEKGLFTISTFYHCERWHHHITLQLKLAVHTKMLQETRCYKDEWGW